MDSLYQEKILNWAKQSRTVIPLSGASHSASSSNPLCGDRVEVCLRINDDNVITDVSAVVRGCALCEAGAGLFVSVVRGTTATSLKALQTGFSDWLAGDDDAVTATAMNDFTPVRNIKNRQKCVVLAFEAGVAALTSNPK